ncbi:hypothetical protein [Algoriphagus namhaensis]
MDKISALSIQIGKFSQKPIKIIKEHDKRPLSSKFELLDLKNCEIKFGVKK